MSDHQPSWMPDATALDDLVGRIEYAYDGPNTSSLACSILSGAIRSAAEKALAEQHRQYSCPICGGIAPDSGRPCACAGTNDVRVAFDYLHSEWGRLIAEGAEQEARLEREVLNAQVSSLVRIEALLASRRGTALQVVRDAIDIGRAELAALDAGGGVKP